MQANLAPKLHRYPIEISAKLRVLDLGVIPTEEAVSAQRCIAREMSYGLLMLAFRAVPGSTSLVESTVCDSQRI